MRIRRVQKGLAQCFGQFSEPIGRLTVRKGPSSNAAAPSRAPALKSRNTPSLQASSSRMLHIQKLEAIRRRCQELDQLLCDPAVTSDLRRLLDLNRERSQVGAVVEAFNHWADLEKRIREDREALSDPEIGPLAREELPELEKALTAVEQQIQVLLLPQDPNDEKNTLLEIRAGTGGEEAALFAADLFRMYARYAETRGWKVEILSSSDAAAGGLKEVIALVTGTRVFSSLKYEGGVHRVQRVPATETQVRIHTSTATVAVLPEAEDVDVQLDDKDLRF